MMQKTAFAALAAAGLALGGCNQAVAGDPAAQELADRIAIEDMIVNYYEHLGTGSPEGIGAYYTEDAVLDVNGIVKTGHAEIESLYVPSEDGESLADMGTFHMLLSNAQISVDGDTATAEFIWTGIMNSDIHEAPRFQEQGREYDRLVKRDGKWLITKRVIIADSGLPARYDATYEPRLDYDIAKDD